MAFTAAKKQGNGDYPAKWDRNSQPVLVGRFVEHKFDVMGKPGANVLTIETPNGSFSVWTGKVLEDYFSTIPLKSVVRIEYLGQEKCKNSPGSFNNFKVDVGDESDLDEAYGQKVGESVMPWEDK